MQNKSSTVCRLSSFYLKLVELKILFSQGLFYYSLLSSTSPGPLRERLESLDFFFGEQNWLNTIVTNLQFWFIFFVGNLTLRLFLRGPQGIVEGIQMSEFEAIVRNVILPRNAW